MVFLLFYGAICKISIAQGLTINHAMIHCRVVFILLVVFTKIEKDYTMKRLFAFLVLTLGLSGAVGVAVCNEESSTEDVVEDAQVLEELVEKVVGSMTEEEIMAAEKIAEKVVEEMTRDGEKESEDEDDSSDDESKVIV